MREKDLEIYDVWVSPNGNMFIKISDNYSIGIGHGANHEPNEVSGKAAPYVKADDVTPVKKVGKIVFE